MRATGLFRRTYSRNENDPRYVILQSYRRR